MHILSKDFSVYLRNQRFTWLDGLSQKYALFNLNQKLQVSAKTAFSLLLIPLGPGWKLEQEIKPVLDYHQPHHREVLCCPTRLLRRCCFVWEDVTLCSTSQTFLVLTKPRFEFLGGKCERGYQTHFNIRCGSQSGGVITLRGRESERERGGFTFQSNFGMRNDSLSYAFPWYWHCVFWLLEGLFSNGNKLKVTKDYHRTDKT